MPVTLAQAQANTQMDVDFNVIDNLRRYSWLMDRIVFDDTVTPGTGNASLTYGYTRLVSAAPAGFRAFNSEYVPGQAVRQRYSVDLKPLGGAITIDRVLANLGQATTNEITFQMQQLLTSIRTRFAMEVILGDTAVDGTGFDGLSKALVGSPTERVAGYLQTPGGGGVTSDWRAQTVTGVDEANKRLDELDDWLSNIVPSHVGGGDQGAPGALPPGEKALMGNTKVITRMKSLARAAASYTSVKDDLGRQIERYADWALVDIGDRYDGMAPIIPLGTNGTYGTPTDLYAVTFGLDAFHAASAAGRPLIQTWLPDYQTAGAVKTGEIELGPVAMVLKNVKAAGVLRGIGVS